ncbi:hypothetical protein LCGC14_1753480 [marine sediment metagenome]|uniref:LamG-like jellyroll fold domain-containing protein n=1 Tax=marine sediment metagenome TaxID=412755 RepID=A0A0F9JIB7_9ZZZZ
MNNKLFLIPVLFLLVPLVLSLSPDDANLLAWLPMNESSGKLIDYSTVTSQFNFSSFGDPTYRQTGIGHSEFSIDLDGTGDYFRDVDGIITDLISSRNSLTIGVMVNPDTSNPAFIVGNREDDGEFDGHTLEYNSGVCPFAQYIAVSINAQTWACAESAITFGEDVCMVGKWNSTGVSLYMNGTQTDYVVSTVGTNAEQRWFSIGNAGQDPPANDPLDGRIADVVVFDRPLTDEEIVEYCANGITTIAPDSTPPTFSGNQRNVTIPLTEVVVGFDINITSSDNVTGYIFAYDNGTGDQFYNSSFQELPDKPSIANVTYNYTMYNTSGVTFQWKWFANNSYGTWGVSSVYSLIVGGTTAPNVTIHSNNFFNDQNTTVINLDQSKTARLNFTLTDDIQVYGFELVILDPNGITSYNLTNATMDWTISNFTRVVNVSSFSEIEGTYTINITAWDSHTALAIPNYKVDTGKDYLIFDDAIRISADDALTAKATKQERLM